MQARNKIHEAITTLNAYEGVPKADSLTQEGIMKQKDELIKNLTQLNGLLVNAGAEVDVVHISDTVLKIVNHILNQTASYDSVQAIEDQFNFSALDQMIEEKGSLSRLYDSIKALLSKICSGLASLGDMIGYGAKAVGYGGVAAAAGGSAAVPVALAVGVPAVPAVVVGAVAGVAGAAAAAGLHRFFNPGKNSIDASLHNTRQSMYDLQNAIKVARPGTF